VPQPLTFTSLPGLVCAWRFLHKGATLVSVAEALDTGSATGDLSGFSWHSALFD
jgi:ABC-type arginine transport system permease subunit